MGLMDNLLLLERSILSESELKLCHMCRGCLRCTNPALVSQQWSPQTAQELQFPCFSLSSIFVMHASVCAVGLGGFPHLRKENSHFLFNLSAQTTKGFVLLLQLWEFYSHTTEGFNSLCRKTKCPNTTHQLHFESGTAWAATPSQRWFCCSSLEWAGGFGHLLFTGIFWSALGMSG